MSRLKELVSRRLGSFAGDRRGSVALTFGLMAIMMLVMVGGAIDFGRWLSARHQTIAAMDAAVLAGARSLQLSPADITAAVQAAERYYTENTKSRLLLRTDNIHFEASADATAFAAKGNATIGTLFLGLADIDELMLLAEPGAKGDDGTGEHARAELQVGGDAGTNLEISLMLDTSGSMGGTKMTDLKAAAKDLIDIVIWEDQSEFTSKVSLAPFSADVRLPSSWNAAARGSPAASKTLSYACKKKNKWTTCTTTYYLTSCVVERAGAQKYTDAAPSSGQYVMAEYTTSGNCSQSASNEVVALSSDKGMLTAKIDALVTGGGTAGHLGTAWAWYTLSPNWSSVVPASGAPRPYGQEDLQKIAILMTDGEYNTEYDAAGIRTGSSGAGSAANGSSNTQARSLCDSMKAKGITVYTVGFDLGGNTTAIDTLEYCASDPAKFYNAEDGAELRASFRDIAMKLSSLRLSK